MKLDPDEDGEVIIYDHSLFGSEKTVKFGPLEVSLSELGSLGFHLRARLSMTRFHLTNNRAKIRLVRGKEEYLVAKGVTVNSLCNAPNLVSLIVSGNQVISAISYEKVTFTPRPRKMIGNKTMDEYVSMLLT